MGDVSLIRTTIPRHSIAVLTGERAQTEDPRVGNPTDGIIEAQRREIGKMKTLIGEIEWKQVD